MDLLHSFLEKSYESWQNIPGGEERFFAFRDLGVMNLGSSNNGGTMLFGRPELGDFMYEASDDPRLVEKVMAAFRGEPDQDPVEVVGRM